MRRVEVSAEGWLNFVDRSGIWTAIKGTDYVLVPDAEPFRKSYETVIDTGMVTEKGVHAYRDYKFPAQSSIGGVIVLFGTSGALNAVASDANSARVNLKVFGDGNKLIGSATGVERIPNSTTEVTYNEIIVCDVRKYEGVDLQHLTIRVELEVLAADANGIQMKLYADPADATKSLKFFVSSI